MPALLPQYQRVSGSGAASHGSFFPWAMRGKPFSVARLELCPPWYGPAKFLCSSNGLGVHNIKRGCLLLWLFAFTLFLCLPPPLCYGQVADVPREGIQVLFERVKVPRSCFLFLRKIKRAILRLGARRPRPSKVCPAPRKTKMTRWKSF